ncbi:protein kinase domain-containing protein [Gimesia maris]|uniref:protein kinase domain-containing protein n=1 Tax=Gimesia maris TaxID=122 RepID=UPI003A92C0D0
MDELSETVDVSRSSLYDAKRKGNCSKKTFAAIMSGLALREEQLRRLPMRQELEPTNERVPPNGWSIESIESPPLVAANGVSYQIAKLSSKYLQQPVRYARGKFYDTLDAPPVSRREYQERITRHAAVCALLPRGTRVPNHIDIRPLADETAWWVLDEWIPSMPLASLIESGVKFPEAKIKSIGTQLLETLAILHSHSCIVRELASESVLIEEDSTNCYITDFEMAQLLVSDISVSGKWKSTRPYRAPEVSENDTHWQSDLYSWAMIVVELFSGSPNRDDVWVRSCSPSETIAKLLVQCLDLRYHYRPASINAVLKVWNKWSAKP